MKACGLSWWVPLLEDPKITAIDRTGYKEDEYRELSISWLSFTNWMICRSFGRLVRAGCCDLMKLRTQELKIISKGWMQDNWSTMRVVAARIPRWTSCSKRFGCSRNAFDITHTWRECSHKRCGWKPMFDPEPDMFGGASIMLTNRVTDAVQDSLVFLRSCGILWRWEKQNLADSLLMGTAGSSAKWWEF